MAIKEWLKRKMDLLKKSSISTKTIDNFLATNTYPFPADYKDPVYQEKIKRLILWSQGEKQYPVVVEIYPTQKCNLKCIYCWQRSQETSRNELKTEDWLRIIEYLEKAKVKRIDITGGEPLCKPKIETIFSLIKQKGIEGHLVSNGTLFNKNLIKLLVNIKWDSIALSLDSLDPKIHDSLRGKGSFKKVIDNIKMFNKLKKGKYSRPVLTINTTLTNKNYKEIPKLFRFAKNFDIYYISILPLVAYHKKGEELLIRNTKEKELRKYLAKAYLLSKKYGIETSIKDVIKEDLSKKAHSMNLFLENTSSANIKFNPICFHPFTLLTIKEDGAITPCPLSDLRDEKFEKNKNLDDLWFGKTFTKFREAMLKHEIPPYCSICCIPKMLETKYLENHVNKFFKKEKNNSKMIK